jgi:hypothetical protein
MRREATAVLVTRDDVAVTGYAMLTPSRTGLQLGPCCASSAEVARSLVEACLARAGAAEVVVGYPSTNPAARALLGELRFMPAPPSLRMVRGAREPLGCSDLVFGIASGATG